MRVPERQGTVGGAAAAVVAAALGLATSFGVHLSAQEHDSILTFAGAVAVAAPLVGALLDHSRAQGIRHTQAVATIHSLAAGFTSPDKMHHIADLEARIDELQRQRRALG